MKVHIEQAGVTFMPYKNIPPEIGMALANKATLRYEDGCFYYTYHCKAENGIEKDIIDWDYIPTGDYNLKDEDWQVPEEVGIRDDEW